MGQSHKNSQRVPNFLELDPESSNNDLYVDYHKGKTMNLESDESLSY